MSSSDNVNEKLTEIHSFHTILRDLTNYVHRPRDVLVVPRPLPVQMKSDFEKNLESVIESCPAKSFIALVAGYGLGAVLGLFSSSVGPTTVLTPNIENQTVREVFRDMRQTSHSYGKNFALIGLVFSAVECTIESVCTFTR